MFLKTLLLISPVCASLEAGLSTLAEQVVRTKLNFMVTASSTLVSNWTWVVKFGKKIQEINILKI